MFSMTLAFKLKTAYTDPGIIPRNHVEEDKKKKKTKTPFVKKVTVKNTNLDSRFCTTCKIYKPPRATHCGVCDNCVERFDHHCKN